MFGFLKRPSYHHLNKIFVNRQALTANYQALERAHPEAKIAPVLKSNAYGHGLVPVAKIVDTLHAPFLAVDSLYEAYELYKEGIRTPILILGFTHPDNYRVKKLPFHFTVYDLETAQALNTYQPGAHIHIFVDTGMCREGVTMEELPTFLESMIQLRQLKIAGLASHLADADNPTSQKFSELQLANFKKAQTLLRHYGLEPEWQHLSASAGSFKYHEAGCNVIRAGLAFYGINPLADNDPEYSALNLQPALRFETTLTQIKQIPAGSKVSYNGTFTAKKPMTIGILPVGYYDGVDRRLSNKGWVKVGQSWCPILGRVCMNLTIIDLTSAPAAQAGQKVLVYSDQPADKNSLVHAASLATTIPYELMVKLAESIRRELI